MSKHIVPWFFHKISKVIIGSMLLFTVLLIGLSSPEAKDEGNKDNLTSLKVIMSDRILGKSTAPVTIIEYASMTCSHCASFHAGPFQSLKKEYIETGKVKFIYRDFPLDRLALAAAMMARCAPKEQYYPIVNIIFKTQQSWAKEADPTSALSRIGLLAGISEAKYKACVGNKDIYDGVMKIRTDGEKKFQIQSTPTVIINGKTFNGEPTIESLRTIINAELTKVTSRGETRQNKSKMISEAQNNKLNSYPENSSKPTEFLERIKKWFD